MKMMNKTETGRSMVEILGMLAVVGVLSVVMILGYIYAMNLWRENQTIDTVNQTAIGAVSGYLGTTYDVATADTPLNLANVTSGISLADDETAETALGMTLTAYRPNENEIELRLENVTYSVCKRLLARSGEYSSASLSRGSENWVLSDDSEEDKDVFCESVDAMKRTPMRPGESYNPNANIVICYAIGGAGCHGGAPIVPPVVCTDYKLCGQQCGGDIHVHPGKQRNPANPCQECDVSSDFSSWRAVANCCNDNADCTGECEVCNNHRCELQGIETSYKVKEGACCVEKKYTQCAGEPARMDECATDIIGGRARMEECVIVEEMVNDCTGAVVSTRSRPRSATTSCGTDGCSRCDGMGNCVSILAKVTHLDLNTDSTVCACETTEEEYCPLTGPAPAVRTCSAPAAPTCNGQSCCTLTGPTDTCNRPTAVVAAPVTITKCNGTTEECCPLTAPGGICQNETNCSCQVGSNTYPHGATIGVCKQCNNGSVVAKSGYTLPSCKVCNADGTLGNDPTCCTVGTTTYANGETIGVCKQCNNGSIVAKSGYSLPRCKVCQADGTLGDDTSSTCVGPAQTSCALNRSFSNHDSSVTLTNCNFTNNYTSSYRVNVSGTVRLTAPGNFSALVDGTFSTISVAHKRHPYSGPINWSYTLNPGQSITGFWLYGNYGAGVNATVTYTRQ